MTIDIFRECRQRIPVEAAVRFYGSVPSRAGFIRCPFHLDKTPSLKLWRDHWKCFGCNASGSVIDFVAKLFDLTPLESVRKLNYDFSLDLPIGRDTKELDSEMVYKRQHDAEVYRWYEEWRSETLDLLSSAIRVGNSALIRCPETWSEEETESVRWSAVLESWLDELESRDMASQIGVFRLRREVDDKCRTILHLSSMR